MGDLGFGVVRSVGWTRLVAVAALTCAMLAAPGSRGETAHAATGGVPSNGLIVVTLGLSLEGVDQEGDTAIGLVPGQLAEDASWSPDGQRLVFESHGDLVSAGLNGEDLTVLTDTAAVETDPTWSPDGTRIAFSRNYELWVMDADGSNQTQVTDVCCDREPSWSPDGSKLAFTRTTNGDNEIFTIDLDQPGLATQLTDAPNDSVTPDWSPDGSKIAFITNRSSTQSSNLWVMSADGSNQASLTGPASAFDPSWSPDGSFIAYAGGKGVEVIPSGGGTPTLASFTGDSPDWQPLPPCTISGTSANDLLQGTPGNDVICAGAGDDRVDGGGGDDILLGETGTDTLAFDVAGPGVRVDLQRGLTTGQGTARVIGVENVIGTNADDELRGNLAANELTGGDGADALSGDDGPDTLDGGSGTDTVVGTGIMKLDLAVGTLEESGATDSLSGIENAQGLPNAPDDLRGDSGPNKLDGGGGQDGGLNGGLNDYLRGRGGDDVLEGGVAVYDESPAPVTADLDAGVADGDGHDTLVDVAGAYGSEFDDQLVGPAAPRRSILAGFGGDDDFVVNPKTFIEGMAGDDTVVFVGAARGIRLDLTVGQVSYGLFTLPFTGVEDVTGTPYSDDMRGSPATDRLNGAGGDDIIAGQNGSDQLFGGRGDDLLTPGGDDDEIDGGVGTDTISFATADAGIVADLRHLNATGEGIDILANLEGVLGSAFEDVLREDSAPNRLDGGPENDAIYGRPGDDLIVGGTGTDSIFGGEGRDELDARDRRHDLVDGGPQHDTCRLDPVDIARSCP